MRSWTPNQWNRAIAAKHKINCEIKAELDTETALMRAWDETVDGKRSYTVIFVQKRNGQQIYETATSKTFFNKNEANAYWVVMRRKWFPTW